ncbi:hypothetical protein SAMN05444004_12914 [Jannaschia faecimaris]|uniref:NAD(P)H-binding n=1 Tax=Jannaschia faecimaris TaxID=1244108 RepID=A0A1H3UCC9_9RHOB|nr:hypothetical protein SAMN05444004_12914 [Jannaschia faecimaris]
MLPQPILVMGANGKTGRRTASTLSKKGFSVRPGTRNALIPFDWDDETTWVPAQGYRVTLVGHLGHSD